MTDALITARWRAKLKTREALLDRARKAYAKAGADHARLKSDHSKAAKDKAGALLRKRRRQVGEAQRVLLRHKRLDVTVAFDQTPTFYGLAVLLQECRKRGWAGGLASSDRRKGVAERYGKKSQWFLYQAYWVWHLKGYNPANKPGASSHELCSDAVGFPGPVGRKLAWWQLGLDVSDDKELVDHLKALGIDARHTYPHSAAEAHHINLFSDPTPVIRRLLEKQ